MVYALPGPGAGGQHPAVAGVRTSAEAAKSRVCGRQLRRPASWWSGVRVVRGSRTTAHASRPPGSFFLHRQVVDRDRRQVLPCIEPPGRPHRPARDRRRSRCRRRAGPGGPGSARITRVEIVLGNAVRNPGSRSRPKSLVLNRYGVGVVQPCSESRPGRRSPDRAATRRWW